MGRLANDIALYFGVEEDFIQKIINRANFYYRTIQIPKRRGGFRDIYLPSPEIKAFQHFICERYLSKLPISDYAIGYRKGKSIIDNVKPHIGNKSFLMLDIKDFFESISTDHFREILDEKNKA